MAGSIKILAGNSNAPLAEAIAAYLGVEDEEVEEVEHEIDLAEKAS